MSAPIKSASTKFTKTSTLPRVVMIDPPFGARRAWPWSRAEGLFQALRLLLRVQPQSPETCGAGVCRAAKRMSSTIYSPLLPGHSSPVQFAEPRIQGDLTILQHIHFYQTII